MADADRRQIGHFCTWQADEHSVAIYGAIAADKIWIFSHGPPKIVFIASGQMTFTWEFTFFLIIDDTSMVHVQESSNEFQD